MIFLAVLAESFVNLRFVYLYRKVLLASMTEVTLNSAMVREPTAIHTDETGTSEPIKMPDLSETKLRRARNRSPSGGDLKQDSSASHSDSCSEAEDLGKSDTKEEVSV